MTKWKKKEKLKGKRCSCPACSSMKKFRKFRHEQEQEEQRKKTGHILHEMWTKPRRKANEKVKNISGHGKKL